MKEPEPVFLKGPSLMEAATNFPANAPEKLPLPTVSALAPRLMSPVPLRAVIVTFACPLVSRPLAGFTVTAVVGKAVALPSFTLPPLIVHGPRNAEFAPFSTSVPGPLFVSGAAPVMLPSNVVTPFATWSVFAEFATSIAPLKVRSSPLPNVKVLPSPFRVVRRLSGLAKLRAPSPPRRVLPLKN